MQPVKQGKVQNTKTKQNEFRITPSKWFQTLEKLMEEETVDGKWNVVKEIITKSCQQVLGPTKYYTHKETEKL